jgi:hypothetical protein
MHLPQQSVSSSHRSGAVPQHLPPRHSPLQQSSPAAQEPPSSRQDKHTLPVLNTLQIPLQHSLSAVQEPGLVGVKSGVQHLPLAQIVPLQHCWAVCSVQVPLFGMHIGVVVVEVVLVEVEVVLVVVVVVGAAVVVVVVLSHGPRRSPWPRWPSTALSGTSLVFSAGVPGLWQMVTFCCRARAREGISAAMAVPAKSLSALRRLIEPSARALARSSKERSVVCWLTCAPFLQRAVH